MELAGRPRDFNTLDQPERIKPTRTQWPHTLRDGQARRTFAPRSFTVITFEQTSPATPWITPSQSPKDQSWLDG